MTFNTEEAARYCGMKVSAFRYHVYKKHAIQPVEKLTGDWIGTRLVFRQEDLDQFKAAKKGRGRAAKKDK
jgi:hypothetical protein